MSLQGQPARDTYQRWLNIPSGNVDSNFKRVQDGQGNESGLQLNDEAVKVDRLEFNATPATSTDETIQVLVNQGNIARQKTIYPFGQAQKDPFNGFWEFVGATQTVANVGAGVVVDNTSATTLETHKPIDIATVDAYEVGTGLFLKTVDGGTGFELTVELTIETGNDWVVGTDYVEVGINQLAGTEPTSFIKRYDIKTVDDKEKITYDLSYYVTSSISANGFTLCVRSYGHNTTVEDARYFLSRTYKR
jgi:hypothetical protein